MSESTDTPTIDPPSFAQWVILELMGHRRFAGYLTEQEVAGRGFLRLDVPGEPTNSTPAVTQFYNPTSVYCITPVTEAMARAVAARSAPEPVQRWELPRALHGDTGEPVNFEMDEGPF